MFYCFRNFHLNFHLKQLSKNIFSMKQLLKLKGNLLDRKLLFTLLGIWEKVIWLTMKSINKKSLLLQGYSDSGSYAVMLFYWGNTGPNKYKMQIEVNVRSSTNKKSPKKISHHILYVIIFTSNLSFKSLSRNILN